MSFRPFKPGVAFRNEKLYIFSKYRVIVLRGWPTFSAWTKCKSQPQWVRFRPDLNIARLYVGETKPTRRKRDPKPGFSDLPEQELKSEDDAISQKFNEAALAEDDADEVFLDKSRWESAFEAFAATIPSEPRRMVSPLPSRHWHVLAMLARCPGADELLASNPALAFCLASNWVFHQPRVRWSMRSIRGLMCKKQKHIAEWLGFPGNESTVKILKKMEPAACRVGTLLSLKKLLWRRDKQKQLCHLPGVNTASVRILSSSRISKICSSRLLFEISEDARTDFLPPSFRMLLDVCRIYPFIACDWDTLRLRSSTHLKWLHPRLVIVLDQDADQKIAKSEAFQKLPSAPFAGNNIIKPLEYCEQLRWEGWIQNNCAANYIKRVRRGVVCLYRVQNPERATLLLRRHRGRWFIDQLLGAHNRLVKLETKKAVMDWFHTLDANRLWFCKPRGTTTPPY